jgi:hypothetical protein
MDAGGRLRFGEAVLPGNNYIYFNGITLDVSGVLNATEGNIGGWSISSAGLQYTSADSNRQLKLNSTRGAFEVFYSGSLVVDINSNPSLTNLTAATAVFSELTNVSSGTIQGDGTPKYGATATATCALVAGRTYEFSWGTGFIPSVTVNGDWGSVGYGLILSTNSTPTLDNATYTLSDGVFRNSGGTAQLQSFNSVFTATATATYYVRPFIQLYSSEQYEIFTPPYYDYQYVNGSLNAALYFYGTSIVPSIEKTEMVGGGIQIIKDSNTFFKVDRNAGGGVGDPFIKAMGASVEFRGASVGAANDFTVGSFENCTIGSSGGYIAISAGSVMSIYDTQAAGSASGGMRINSNNFIRLEPNGPGGYFAYVGYSNNANLQIKVANGTNPSDERVKTEIEILEDGSIEKIKELTLKKFRYRDCETGGPTGHKKIGVIAQDIQKTSLNELVLDNSNGHQLEVDYDSLLGHALKAIQELSAKVDRLENEISSSKI